MKTANRSKKALALLAPVAPEVPEWTILAYAEYAVDWTAPVALVANKEGVPHLVASMTGLNYGLTEEQLEKWLSDGEQPLTENGRVLMRNLANIPADWDSALDWWRTAEQYCTLQTGHGREALECYRRHQSRGEK